MSPGMGALSLRFSFAAGIIYLDEMMEKPGVFLEPYS